MGEIQRDWIDRLYEIDGLSTRDIGAKVGVSYVTVQRWLTEDRVVLRPRFKGGLVRNQGHVRCLCHGHPRADNDGYVTRAILAWEEANHQSFPDGKEPHHKNLVKDDDRPENIEPLTHSEHSRLHANLKHLTEGQLGRANT